MMQKRIRTRSKCRILLSGVGLCLALFAGCADSSPSGGATGSGGAAGSADGKISILATTGMIADAARIVGGDLVTVTALMGPGVDPHLYQPTARDNALLKSAQLVLYNGLHLEGRMIEIFESLAAQKKVIAVSRDIPPALLLSWQSSSGTHDPHIWFDLRLWQQVVRTIAEAFGDLDPQHREDFRQRADAYIAEFARLDEYCRERVNELPAEQRVLITSHDAFHYFGRAYGFEVVGIQGISTDTEAGLRAITDAVDLIRARHIRAIFPETSVPRAAIERVSRDSGAVLASELYSDALGAEDGPAGTYLGMIRTNLDHIVDALSGKIEKVEKNE